MRKRQSDEQNRAEKIRARRQHSRKSPSKPTLENSATRKQTTSHVPVTRRRTSTTPVNISNRKNKVHVPLKSKGAELHLPAFPKLQFGWRFISGAIFLLSLAVVISFSSLNTFEVSKITLQGAQRLSADAIFSQVNLEGTSIIKVQPEEITAQVTDRFPSLSSVKVSAGLPASVTIHVKEREPLVLWQQNNESLWIDAEGVMFPVRGEAEVPLTVIANSDPPGAPQAVSPAEEKDDTIEVDTEFQEMAFMLGQSPAFPRTTPDFIQGILTLSSYVPENSFLQYDPQFGLGWQDPGGWLVYFGNDINTIDIKLAEYQVVLAAIKEGNLTPALISLEFLHAPFYRLEQ